MIFFGTINFKVIHEVGKTHFLENVYILRANNQSMMGICCRLQTYKDYMDGLAHHFSMLWNSSIILRIRNWIDPRTSSIRRNGTSNNLKVPTHCTSFASHSHGPHSSFFFKQVVGFLIYLKRSFEWPASFELITPCLTICRFITQEEESPMRLIPDHQIRMFLINVSFASRAHIYSSLSFNALKWLWGIMSNGNEMFKYEPFPTLCRM